MPAYLDLETMLQDMVSYVRSVGTSRRVQLQDESDEVDLRYVDWATAQLPANTVGVTVHMLVHWEIPLSVLRGAQPDLSRALSLEAGRQAVIRTVQARARARMPLDETALASLMQRWSDTDPNTWQPMSGLHQAAPEAPPLLSWDRLKAEAERK